MLARPVMGTIFLVIFMGMWVIVNWWVWPVPDFHFRKLEAMSDAVMEYPWAFPYQPLVITDDISNTLNHVYCIEHCIEQAYMVMNDIA